MKPCSISTMQRLVLVGTALGISSALLFTVPQPVSAAKGGGHGGGGPATTYLRATFTPPGAMGIDGDGEFYCIGYQYWLTVPSESDPNCPGNTGNVKIGTTSDGLFVFRTHDGETVLQNGGAPPGLNRYVKLQFPATGTNAGGTVPCPDIDATFYNNLDPAVTGYVPVPAAGCEDDVEMLFRAGHDNFDATSYPVIIDCVDDNNCPALEVQTPNYVKKRKSEYIGWPTVATIRFRDGLVLDKPNPNDDVITISCESPCSAEVRESGVTIGTYDLPFEMTVGRFQQ